MLIGSDHNLCFFNPPDVSEDGRIDLIGLSSDGEPVQAINHGTKNYSLASNPSARRHRLQAISAINSFRHRWRDGDPSRTARTEAIGHGSDCPFLV